MVFSCSVHKSPCDTKGNTKMKKKTYVFIGNFGSGKSELALNLAVEKSKANKTLVVDLDIINPYFRISERVQFLHNRGVRLISPNFVLTNVETLSLPPDIYSAFIDEHHTVIFDVGGDAAGAMALGQYKSQFDSLENLEVWFVVNGRRPLSSSADQVLALIDGIRACSRLNVTGLINNTNLSNETTGEDILYGSGLLAEVSKRSGIPVVFTTGMKEPLEGFRKLLAESGLFEKGAIGELWPIERYMRRDWDRFVDGGGL